MNDWFARHESHGVKVNLEIFLIPVINPQSGDDSLARVDCSTQTSLDDQDPRRIQLQLLDNVLHDEGDHPHTLHLLLLPGAEAQHVGVPGEPVEVADLGQVVQFLTARAAGDASVDHRVEERPLQLPHCCGELLPL